MSVRTRLLLAAVERFEFLCEVGNVEGAATSAGRAAIGGAPVVRALEAPVGVCGRFRSLRWARAALQTADGRRQRAEGKASMSGVEWRVLHKRLVRPSAGAFESSWRAPEPPAPALAT